MTKKISFDKVSEVSESLKKHTVNFSNEVFVINNHQFSEMLNIGKLYIKLMANLYKKQEYFNKKLSLTKKIQQFPTPKLTFSPMRFDFLCDSKNNLILSDINLPGSFVPDIFWPIYGINNQFDELICDKKNYICYNAYVKYHQIISNYLGDKYKILRFLDNNTNKLQEQRNFLKNLYQLINELKLINLNYSDQEINQKFIQDLDSNFLVSLFLNTHNSPENLSNSIEILLNSDRPIFVNPKLLPFTDKKPPSLDFLRTILKDNKAEYMNAHLPKVILKGNTVIKRRFGHSSSSYVTVSLSTEEIIRNQDLYPYSEVKVEKLQPIPYQGLSSKVININNKLVKNSIEDYLFEISLNIFIVTRGTAFNEVLDCVSVSSRGAKSHPISGPHTLLFPTVIGEV